MSLPFGGFISMTLVLLDTGEVRLTACGVAGDVMMEHKCGRDHMARQDARDSQVGVAFLKPLTPARITTVLCKICMFPF